MLPCSPYLQRPLRTLDQAKRERAAKLQQPKPRVRLWDEKE